MGPFKDGWTKEQVEETILRGKVDELLYVPIVVGLSPPDFEWADSVLRRLVGHEDRQVRSNVILGFSHLTRLYRKVSDEGRRVILDALSDPDDEVRLTANDTCDDIEVFLKHSIR
jgi:hypothetical protein